MKIVRTIVWVLLLIALLIFSVNNWNPVEVKIWEGLVLETKMPALVVIAFLVGLLPMWLLHRASLWNNERRIASLENAARASAMVAPAASPTVETPVASPPVEAPAAEPAPVVEPLPEEPRTDLSTDETKPTP